MNKHSTLGYQAVVVLKEALEDAQSADHKKLNVTIHKPQLKPGPSIVMSYEGIEFDSTGLNPHARELMLQVQNEKVVTVWPAGFASAKPQISFR